MSINLNGKYLNDLRVERALEAQFRSSAGRRVRPAVVIRCGVAADPFEAADAAVASTIGAIR